jgi:hypothetical protein
MIHYNRKKIREYIKKQLGRDPQDNFDIIGINRNDWVLNLLVKFSLRKEDNLEIGMPYSKAI